MFNFLSKKTQKSVRTLSEYEETKISELYEDGMKPTAISELINVDLVLVNRFINVLQKRAERARANKGSSEYDELKEALKLERLKHELEILKEKNKLDLEKKQLELEARRQELYGEDDEDEDGEESSPEMRIFEAFINKISNNNIQSQSFNTASAGFVAPESVSPPLEQQNQQTTLTNNELSEKQITDIISKIPKQYIKIAQKMDDDALKVIIRNKYSLPENTLNKAVEVLKSV